MIISSVDVFLHLLMSLQENDSIFKQLLASYVEHEEVQIYVVQRKRDRLQAYFYWLRDDVLRAKKG